MAKRKPKCVPLIDVDGNYTVDANFAQLKRDQPPKEPSARTFGAAYRSPPEPPPEEALPIRRYSPHVEDRPKP